ncbi:unnamed protein product [Nyctereutes procyonoides]|uniref:(raccoon dog) hypothetical protein n=1 Tax=Nyctereutes procyonoides TaxID=34880 RepID=A0A811Y2S3_NYCPR|nr:unnamed protein product [Nyctereutes procyonoides]
MKLFIGNMPKKATEQKMCSLFKQCGKVLQCGITKNYHFGQRICTQPLPYKLHRVDINVEASKKKSKNTRLRAKFEVCGLVVKCDIVKDYPFLHMNWVEDAVEAIRDFDNTEYQSGMCVG